MANGTQLVVDAFPGVTLAPAWTAFTGRAIFQAVSGVAEPIAVNTSYAGYYSGIANNADQYGEIKMGATFVGSVSTVTILVRAGTAISGGGSAGYIAQAGAGSIKIFNGTTFVQIGPTKTQTLNPGDTFRLEAVGINLNVIVNGIVVLSAMDANFAAAGNIGMQVFVNTAQTLDKCAVTNFRAGNTLPTANDGIWTKKGWVIPTTAADLGFGTGGLPGTQNQTMLYEGGSQLGLGAGNVFKMWFGGGGNIFYAESLDGITWTRKAAAVLSGVSLPRIFKNGATYYLYVAHASVVWTQVDQYTSADGVTWALGSANVLSAGGVGTWDHDFCGYFQVVDINAGTWRAIYDGALGTAIGAGLATSPDGVVWTKNGGNPVVPTSANMAGGWDVHLIGGTYYGWANTAVAAIGGETAYIARMQSTDLVTWTNRVMSVVPDNSFEGVNTATGEVAIPSLLEVNGTTYMYYSATPNDGVFTCPFQIALATTPRTLASIVSGQEYFSKITQVATDNFTRANENPLSQGGKWGAVVAVAPLQIASNFCEPSATTVDCMAVNIGSAVSADQYSQVTLQTLAGGGGSIMTLLVRALTAADTSYEGLLNGATGSGSNLTIYRRVAGVETAISPTFIVTPQIGHILRFSVTTSTLGPVLSYYINELLIIQVTDTSALALLTGKPGIRMNGTAVANTRASAFAGGNASGGSGGGGLLLRGVG